METIFYKEVLHPFLLMVEMNKERNAFCIAEQCFTYSDLAKSISKIRKAIRSYASKQMVGLVANDDLDTYASIWALWLEGKAYVPLHPKQPIDRCLEIIDQVELDLIIDSSATSRYETGNVLLTGQLEFSGLLLEPVQNVSESDLAYILFTSGSTGKPKGVQLNRKNIGAFMNAFWETGVTLNQEDRCLQCFDLTFDVSVQSFIAPLVKGACTYTVPHEQIKYSYVYYLMETYKLTFGAMAPSMVRYLKPYFDEINVPSYHTCIMTAEASPLDLISEWSKCIPNARILDFYGPTEGTIYCTYYEYKRDSTNHTLNGMLSIGKPFSGIGVILIDEDKNVLSESDKGEMCISGDQITPGYWDNDEKNSEVFFEKIVDGVNTRFYMTGDLCYFGEDNDIMLYGRKDHQVKIQGYRIELGEIEYHARAFLKTSNAVAIPFTNSTGNTEISLVVEKDAFEIKPLEDYLHSKMPSYMLPTKYHFIPTFPINNSDKVDRVKIKTLIRN